MSDGSNYIGKGPYKRYMQSSRQRPRSAGKGVTVTRSMHFDARKMAKRLGVDPNDLAEMIEHENMKRMRGSNSANAINSPGAKKLANQSKKVQNAVKRQSRLMVKGFNNAANNGRYTKRNGKNILPCKS